MRPRRAKGTLAAAKRRGGDPARALPEGWDRAVPATGAPPGIDRGWAYAPGAGVAEEITRSVREKAARLPGPLATALTDARAPGRALVDIHTDILGSREEAKNHVARLMRHAGAASEPNLTQHEIAVLYDYTEAGYRAVNRALREAAETLPIEDARLSLARLVRDALVKLPARQMTSWRGMDFDPDAEVFLRLASLKAGDKLAFLGFTSTSRSESGAFSGNVRIVIEGRSGRLVEHLSGCERMPACAQHGGNLPRDLRMGPAPAWKRGQRLPSCRRHAFCVTGRQALPGVTRPGGACPRCCVLCGGLASDSSGHSFASSIHSQALRSAVSVGSTTATGCILFYNEPVGIASDIKTMATATGRWY